jgi:hypothetical protein
MKQPHIGLIVTGPATFKDFTLFVKSLELWHPDAQLFVFTDADTEPAIKALRFKGKIHTKATLDPYKGLTRPQMEKINGKSYATLWTDFMYEKTNVMEWMLDPPRSEAPRRDTQKTPQGIWFMDADISHTGPLPDIPAGTQLALCPHMIKATDEAKFGRYNAGYLWLNDRSLLSIWRTYGQTSRFFEQSALEDLKNHVNPLSFYEFPAQVNFGWWRMLQSDTPMAEIQAKFSLFRKDPGLGLRYEGKPVQSFHTHWFEEKAFESQMFRLWFDNFTKKFTAHKPIQQYRQWLGL